MARIARIVLPGGAHHITQRGRNRQDVFFIGDVREMIDSIGDWEQYLALDVEEAELVRLRRHTRTGRPLGNEAFVHRLEEALGRLLRKRKPGPKGPRKKN